MPFLHNGEVRLFYTTHGWNSGSSPLVFVHGWTCDSNDWVWQLSHFSSARTCLALDLRGHGRSSVPSSGFRLVDYATDVVAVLEEVGPAVLVGHSMGALVSSLVAVDRPDLVKALVVVDAPYALEADVVQAAAAFADRVKGVDGIEQVLTWLTGADGPATPAWLAM
ncbi:alpha/beta hydrolase [Nocardioides immobilis]|uniref:Alpha/beta hydrolase n=1 Tax=Nocardioides immobilis TaxID=2049295 RepID=A0A417Y8U9_9ACTN|nr:alpha/beta hydrolase [Nocardioides immobilis]RHW29182.1 alpha/beta hydrolase [Nocardioides immobilis]